MKGILKALEESFSTHTRLLSEGSYRRMSIAAAYAACGRERPEAVLDCTPTDWAISDMATNLVIAAFYWAEDRGYTWEQSVEEVIRESIECYGDIGQHELMHGN